MRREARRCEACRRYGTQLEPRAVAGMGMDLCVDPADCRRNWLKERD